MSTSAIPSIGKPELEYLAEEQMKAFARFNGKDDLDFKVWKFAAYFLRKKVSFEWLSNDGCILGLSSFVDGTPIPVYDPEEHTVKWKDLEADTILLSKDLENPFVCLSKPRFTLMHECAHHLLHTGYFRHKSTLDARKAIAFSVQKDKGEAFSASKQPWTDDDRLEWQANYFASALLMPESRVKWALQKYHLYEDYIQRVNTPCSELLAFRELVRYLAAAFRVSPRMAEIRLQALEFERLPDLRPRRVDPWEDFFNPPKKKRMTREEREWERVELSWERARERDMEREARRRYVR